MVTITIGLCATGADWGEAGYIRLLRRPGNEKCGKDYDPWWGFSCKADLPDHVRVCGTCGILSDSHYPTGAFLTGPPHDKDLYVN